MIVHTIDLHFHTPETIAAYIVEDDSELALIETGPDSVFANLLDGLKTLGFNFLDIKKVFVTHVHLDHAGAAWHFAESGATIYVHHNGERHLSDPSKLLSSAGKIYKERMEELWGLVKPIRKEKIHATFDGEEVAVGHTRIKAIDTQGHASHHNTYFVDGNAFTGDVGGVKLANGPVLPPTPAPDINAELWLNSIEKIRSLNPTALFPTHFGKSTNVSAHLGELKARLLEWTEWVGDRIKEGLDEATIVPQFEIHVMQELESSGVSADVIEAYKNADPFWMNVPGLMRYWNKYRLQANTSL